MPQSAFTSEYTPRSRGDVIDAKTSTPSASQPDPAQSVAIPPQSTAMQPQIPPEGPPPFAASSAPKVEVEPDTQALQVPGTTAEGDPMTIYHIDPSSLPEKPWRRPGADLSDWFNYGFDEFTWKHYGRKKRGINSELPSLSEAQPGQGDGDFSQQQNNNADAMAMMQMMNGQVSSMGNFNPQTMAQMPPQQQMQFMSQMMANGGMGLEAMMAPFLPNGGHGSGGFGVMGPSMGGAAFANHLSPNGPNGVFGMPHVIQSQPQQLQQQVQNHRAGTSSSGPSHRSAAPTVGMADAPVATPSEGVDTKGDSTTGPGSEDRVDATVEDPERSGQPVPSKPAAKDAAPVSDASNSREVPNPAGMAPQDMAVFLGMAGLDPTALNNEAQTTQMTPSGAASPSGSVVSTHIPSGPSGGRGRAAVAGVPGAPRGPSASIRGARTGTAGVPHQSGQGVSAAAPSSSAATVPTGPSAKVPPTGPAADRQLPPNVPTGPRNPGKRYNDRDTGAGSADALDYGGSGPAGAARGESGDPDDRRYRESTGTSRRTGHRGNDASRDSSRLRDSTEPVSPRGPVRRGITIKGRHESAAHEDDSEEGGSTRSLRNAAPRSNGGQARRLDGGPDSDEETTHSSRSRPRDRERDRERDKERDRDREERREYRRDRRRRVDEDRHRLTESPEGTTSSKRERDRDRDRLREKEREERSSARASRRAGRDTEDAELSRTDAKDRKWRKRGASEVEGGSDVEEGGGGGGSNDGSHRSNVRRRK